MKKLFPTFGQRNILVYYLLGIFSNGWFIAANWAFLWLRYMNKFEVGVIDSISVAFAFLMEVPTGAIGDLIGKKKSIILGLVFELIGASMMAFTTTKGFILLGNMVFFLGFAFISGSLEAIAYDSLLEKQLQKHYELITSRFNALVTFVIVIVTILGGVLFAFDVYYPWYAWIVFIAISIPISLFLKEPTVDTIKFNLKSYSNQLLVGFKKLASPKLRKYVFIIFGSLGVYIAFSDGFLRQFMAIEFGFSGEFFSVYVGFVGIIMAFILLKFKEIRQFFGDFKGLLTAEALIILSFIITALFQNQIAGMLVIFIITIAGNFIRPWANVIINKEIDSKYRATTLSTMAMITRIPYIFLGFSAGYLYENNRSNLLYLGILIFLLSLMLISLFRAIRSKKL